MSLLLNYRYLCYFQGVILQSTICFSILEMIISQAKEHLKCLRSDIFISHVYLRWWLSGAWGIYWPRSKDPGFNVSALCWTPNNHRPGLHSLHLFFSPTSLKCSPSQGSSGEPGVPGLPGAMGLPGFKGHKVRVNSCNYIQKNMVYLSIMKSWKGSRGSTWWMIYGSNCQELTWFTSCTVEMLTAWHNTCLLMYYSYCA